MMIKKVTVHKMYEEFRQFPITQYVGEYDESFNLVKLFNSFNQELSRIFGTYQWALIGADEVFFVEEDPAFQGRTL
jgi:hypothetical protein